MADGVAGAIITSVASFAGLMIGFIWNANQFRKTEQNNYYREQSVLRAALLAELESLLQIYSEEIEYSKVNNFTWVVSYDFFNVYKQNISKLGFLTINEVKSITLAFHRYQEHMGYIRRNASDSPNTASATVSNDNVPYQLDNEERRRWLLGDLGIIIAAAEKARSAIAEEITQSHFTK